MRERSVMRRSVFLLGALMYIVVVCGCGEYVGPRLSNQAPVLEAQPDTTAAVGDTLELWAQAHDADGDSLAYGLVAYVTYEEFTDGYKPDVTMSKYTGYFSFRPRDRDRPGRDFMFTVDDGSGGTDSTSFSVHVTE
jgi:hypothetical protein